MPKQKDLKRRIRARMEKTGESYTTARAHVLRKHSASSSSPPLPANYESLAGMADGTLAAKTGRTWSQWIEALDAIGAAGMQHREIARWVQGEIGLGWWSQTVAVGYERIRGLREIGQRSDGGYEAGKSRTFAVPAARLFDAFADEAIRRRWLDDAVTIRKATPYRTLRITWPDETSVEVYLTDKGPSKSTVTIQHTKLSSREEVEQRKAFWADRLEVLAKVLK